MHKKWMAFQDIKVPLCPFFLEVVAMIIEHRKVAVNVLERAFEYAGGTAASCSPPCFADMPSAMVCREFDDGDGVMAFEEFKAVLTEVRHHRGAVCGKQAVLCRRGCHDSHVVRAHTARCGAATRRPGFPRHVQDRHG